MSKGGIISEDNGRFLLLQKNIPNYYPEEKIKLLTVMGGKFKFSAQDRDLEYFFGEVKIFQYLLTLSHLLRLVT